MKKFMLIIWNVIIIYFRMTVAAWAVIGVGTAMFNSYGNKEWYEIGDVNKGIDMAISKAKIGLRKTGKLYWEVIKEIVSCIADEIGSF